MKINLGGTYFEVIYEYKPRNRGIYFRYIGNYKLKITSGRRLSEREIEDMLIKTEARILRLVKRVEAKSTVKNTMHYLGKEYSVEVIEDSINLVSLVDDKMIIRCRAKSSPEKVVRAFYVEMIKNYVEQRFDEVFALFSDLKIKRPQLKYKYTKSFYGKCFARENMIEMSGICMKMEPKYIDCVIMHELCHFKYLNHQSAFYRYFESKLPNAKKIQHEFRSLKYQDIY